MSRKLERAQQMRSMPDHERDEAIAASPNVIDKRVMFGAMQQQRALSQAYKKPKGGGAA